MVRFYIALVVRVPGLSLEMKFEEKEIRLDYTDNKRCIIRQNFPKDNFPLEKTPEE